MILCSPSPGTSGPLKITSHPCCHSGSFFVLYSNHSLKETERSDINFVPGVIQLESTGRLSETFFL